MTAASAAGAALGRSLTERGVANTLVLATGTGCSDDPEPDCTRLSGPGTTTAFYMSVRQAERVSRALADQGLPEDTLIDIAVDIEKPGQRLIKAKLSGLAEAIEANAVSGCAILLVTWPESSITVVNRDTSDKKFEQIPITSSAA